MLILNTRPAGQAASLTQALENKHFSVIELPLISIEAIGIQKKSYGVQTAIFLSANAVTHFYAQATIQAKKFIAIGSATKEALIERGVLEVMCPDAYNSEGLLAMPMLQAMTHHAVAIIAGENSKSLLSETLQARGACVTEISCYRRNLMAYTKKELFLQVISKDITHIVVTSGENLQALLSLFKAFEDYLPWLYQKTLCVINDEMKNAAIKAGFESVIQAKNATNAAIVDVLQEVI